MPLASRIFAYWQKWYNVKAALLPAARDRQRNLLRHAWRRRLAVFAEGPSAQERSLSLVRGLAGRGIFEALNHAVLMIDRERSGRSSSPGGCITDSQSVKNERSRRLTRLRCLQEDHGSRHALVDTYWRGFVFLAHPAVQDRDEAGTLLAASRRPFRFIERVFADAGYQGPRVATATGIAVAIARCKSDQIGFAVQPRRWVVERSLALINRDRRLWKIAEASSASTTAFLYAAAAMVLIRSIAQTL